MLRVILYFSEVFMLFIGIDLGTSSVKLLLMKSGGEILRTVTEEYPVYFPQSGW